MKINELIAISNDEYHSTKGWWSSTALKYLVDHSLEETNHHMNKFWQEYAVLPEFSPSDPTKEYKNFKATNDYKAQLEEFMEDNQGKEIISLETYKSLVECNTSIQGHPFMKELLDDENTQFEKAVFTDFVVQETDGDEVLDEFTFKAKVKFDIINIERGIIVDLKKTRSSTANDFGRDMHTLNYDLQGVFYRNVAQTVFNKEFDFIFCAQEFTEPYSCATFGMHEMRINQGTQKLYKAISKIKNQVFVRQECKEVVYI